MSSRSVRVNELIKREISTVLHTNYRERTIGLTITEADVSPDLRSAYIYYSVIGDAAAVESAERFFSKEHKNIRQFLSKVIVLKYLPKLRFKHDDSYARGSRILDLLEEIDEEPEEQTD
ncbi:30S ribosome-binding factor RbfA [Cerasicoccus arenae]|uniref:Ribosome-binding factor A n=1 Tax=Cerasicoccus arenae TaxID=424488 RepID=A0A8J3GEG7_9BACT|nr:30S ribosome-binding factor RbfA [Cerasicoccus arenae]MBK1857377.1 30S ribosome-binding factor RbfA [Cerasicoccus arenae]GHC09110.1 ribosome-binding factor A [Cerasicoccus arenae]